MNYLLDTNIISEVRKGPQCNSNVAAWYELIDGAEIYLSVLVLGEIRKGLERARRNNPAQIRALENWLAAVGMSFADRILPIDRAIADEWGRMSAKCPRFNHQCASCGDCQSERHDAGYPQYCGRC